jgi:uncharacterized repeat protein (TIGR03803 family)
MNQPGRLLFLALLFSSYAAAQTPALATIYSFTGGSDGGCPSGPPAIGSDGVLYGTTCSSGPSGWGTVFSLTPPASSGGAWTEEVLYTFGGGSDGQYPTGLVIGGGGVLYGITEFGGSGQCVGATCGTVFSLTPPSTQGGSWTKTIIHNFQGGSDGAFPLGTLAIGGGRVLYGATSQGGTGHGTACATTGCGTVFSVTPPPSPVGAWTETVLYTFAANEEGTDPQAGVVIGKGGVLYGTTLTGGSSGCGNCGGTVFALYPPASPGGTWARRTLYTFQGPPTDGAWPSAPLSIGSGGMLYGTTKVGGVGQGCANSCGTVFSLTPPSSPGGAWTEAVLHTFPNYLNESTSPRVALGRGGVLYGATSVGGSEANSACDPHGCGTVFSLTPPASPEGTWTETVLHSFMGSPSQGNDPNTGLAIGHDGVLYGTTLSGGAANAGTVFALKP